MMVQFRPPTSGSNETSSAGLARPQADTAVAPATGKWRERYVTGSWRGVEFLTERHEKEGGRRVATHEFPQRDEPWSEDLGRRARRWTIDCLVIGSNYMATRDALEAALELAGAGRLVHPYLGELTARAETYRLSESTEEGGMARFSIDFVEAGVTLAADARGDSNANAAAKAKDAKDKAPEKFAKKFGVANKPSFVEAAAAAMTKRVAQANAIAARLLGGAGPALRAFEAGIATLDGAVQLVRTPIDLARSIRGTISALGALGSVPLLRIRALFNILDDVRSHPAVIGETADRAQESANRDAIETLVTTLCVAEAVSTAANMTFASYGEAVALRDWLADRIDGLEVVAADAGRIEEAEELAALRLAMIRDISARGASLARLLIVIPRVTEPALVLANRLYGPESIDSRCDDIVARNAVTHPGFLPGGVALQVLTVPEAEVTNAFA